MLRPGVKQDEEGTRWPTAGRWPWKSESAKDCVTTHLPNVLALKMDGAQASHPYLALRVETKP